MLDGVYCERCYTPWTDMEKALRDADLPLYTMETKSPLKDFDIVGFSLLYEMCYTNILTMLELADIPLRAEQRGEDIHSCQSIQDWETNIGTAAGHFSPGWAYGMNTVFVLFSGGKEGPFTGAMKNIHINEPSARYILGDAQNYQLYPGATRRGAAKDTQKLYASDRHNFQANYLFFDGHVASAKPLDAYNNKWHGLTSNKLQEY